ncbi:MAG: hypothetical protein K0Q74_895 [Gammaproteobacteria bacterium]|jgi:GNAT superfamily N-acetyltransferase|nr:hypothetical protein [Gammaproteobacteria bacterium]
MDIEFTTHPQTDDLDFLTKKINEETSEFGFASSFAFFIRNHVGEIIAGCNGSVIFGNIYTDQLWVHFDHRRAGLGYKLMTRVHDYGRKNGCTMATVATMSFQGAEAFYERLGYVADFTRLGYTKESHCIFLRQDL